MRIKMEKQRAKMEGFLHLPPEPQDAKESELVALARGVS